MTILDIFSIVLRGEEIADNSAFGGDSIAADLWTRSLCYAVQGFGEIVFRKFSDLIELKISNRPAINGVFDRFTFLPHSGSL
jgi:hypothetical protein